MLFQNKEFRDKQGPSVTSYISKTTNILKTLYKVVQNLDLNKIRVLLMFSLSGPVKELRDRPLKCFLLYLKNSKEFLNTCSKRIFEMTRSFFVIMLLKVIISIICDIHFFAKKSHKVIKIFFLIISKTIENSEYMLNKQMLRIKIPFI